MSAAQTTRVDSTADSCQQKEKFVLLEKYFTYQKSIHKCNKNRPFLRQKVLIFIVLPIFQILNLSYRTNKLNIMTRKKSNRKIEEICQMWIAEKMQKEVYQEKRKRSETELQEELTRRYDLRYNMVTGQIEFRTKNMSGGVFNILDKRILFTLCLEMRESGINCWDKDIQRFIFSSRIAEYHPMREYFTALPDWDGRQRVIPLIQRLTDNEICCKAMFRWFIALTSQWMGIESGYGNSLAPLLISSIQGVGKSTYCRNIVPESLRQYYTDISDLGQKGKMEQRLVQNCLINLDEFDRIPDNKIPLLKNLMQASNVSVCKAYQSYFSSLPRIASFIATSNRIDILSDPTGSRRFICINTDRNIDNSPIQHKQLYAELKYYIEHDERSWLTKDEEAELQEHNKSFYKESPQMELFRSRFKCGSHDSGEWLNITDIIDIMKSQEPDVMYRINPILMGRELTAAGIKKEHRRDGNYYFVERT